MIRTTRLRRITLHLRHIFFTEACTFIRFSSALSSQLSAISLNQELTTDG